MTKKRTPSPRAVRRNAERAAEKLARAKERVAAIEPGGDPARPVVVESASQVEPHALALECLRCGGPYRLEEHAAVAPRGEPLRVARLVCPQCGASRSVWFRIAPRLPN